MYASDFTTAVAEAKKAIAIGAFDKSYLPIAIAALAAGKPDEARTAYDDMAKVSTREAGWRMVEDASGKPARTHYRVVERFPGCTLVECSLEVLQSSALGQVCQARVLARRLGAQLLGEIGRASCRERV